VAAALLLDKLKFERIKARMAHLRCAGFSFIASMRDEHWQDANATMNLSG
jgi:hypothetical protein